MYDDHALTMQVLKGAERAFFACAYADQAQDAGVPLTGDVLDRLPGETDPAAARVARVFITRLKDENHMWIGALYILNRGDLDAYTWGHYAAMEAMGHDVGLWEHAVKVRIPSIEFTGSHLDRNYFQPTG
ncbi:MAG TPA: hypothetical protein VK054_03930 [Beutenbergiaceae bacterium]|nr:hypothetical protein [Beutenbergiaceae bacterium]